MSKFVYVVFTQPVEGRDDEYNEWYDEVHGPDVTAIDGIKSITRYELAQMDPPQEGHPYLALYEIDADDVAAVSKALRTAARNGDWVISDALDGPKAKATFYKAR